MNIAIVGTGMMGKLVREIAEQTPEFDKVYSIEPSLGETLWDIPPVDVVIDFSHPDALKGICSYIAGREGKTGVVFATTGFSAEDEKRIEELCKSAPVIKSANYSFGIHALKKITDCAKSILGDCSDIEIIEKHHNQKVDSPSGTALLLAEVCDPEHNKEWKCGRKGESKRNNEIGIHSIRGGTIFGEHQIIFAMKDEVIEIHHQAFSKKIFAKGAIEAAIWLNDKKAGMYTLKEIFG